jgi:LysM repeat protein
VPAPALSAILLVICVVLASCKVENRASDDVPAQDTAATAESRDAAVAADGAAPSRDPDDPRSVEQQLQDASLAAQIKLALADDEQLRLLDFEPEVKEGVVVLHGDAPSAGHTAHAAQIAGAVPGVRAVQQSFDEAPIGAVAVDTTRAQDTTAAEPPRDSVPPATPPKSIEAEAETYHTVASGESLWEIARANGTTVAAIQRLNNMQGDRLRPGQRIRVR